MAPITKQVLASPATSRALHRAVTVALSRDPLDALKDAEILVEVVKAEWTAKLQAVYPLLPDATVERMVSAQ